MIKFYIEDTSNDTKILTDALTIEDVVKRADDMNEIIGKEVFIGSQWGQEATKCSICREECLHLFSGRCKECRVLSEDN